MKRDAARYVLYEHSRSDIKGCHCGAWGSDHGHLGQSHVEHVLDELAAAGVVEEAPPMTDTPRDDVTSDDLRERLAQALDPGAWHQSMVDTAGGLRRREYAREQAGRLLPVVAEHTAREVQIALAEQREQIVAALRGAIDAPKANALQRAIRAAVMAEAIRIAREVGKS